MSSSSAGAENEDAHAYRVDIPVRKASLVSVVVICVFLIVQKFGPLEGLMSKHR